MHPGYCYACAKAAHKGFHCNGRQVEVKQQQGTIPQMMPLKNTILKCMATVYAYEDVNSKQIKKRLGYATRIADWLLIQNHLCDGLTPDSTITLVDTAGKEQHFTADLFQKNHKDIKYIDPDFLLVPMRHVNQLNLASAKGMIIDHTDFSDSHQAGYLINAIDSRGVAAIEVIQPKGDEKHPRLKYAAHTEAGDCGSLITVPSTKGYRVAGVHRFGWTGQTVSEAEVFPKELFALLNTKAPVTN